MKTVGTTRPRPGYASQARPSQSAIAPESRVSSSLRHLPQDEVAVLELPGPTGSHLADYLRDISESPHENGRIRGLPLLRLMPEDEVAIVDSPGPSGRLMNLIDHRRETRILARQSRSNHDSFAFLRYMPEDEVAIMEFPVSGRGHLVDRHTATHFGMDNISYEQLLALGERIGSVSMGLSEKAVFGKLKTRLYVSPTNAVNPEEAPCVDQEPHLCVICQAVFENKETIAILDCKHQYHAECLRRWLVEKNLCPICKSPAL